MVSVVMKEEHRRGQEMRVDQSDVSQVSAGLPESGALKDFLVLTDHTSMSLCVCALPCGLNAYQIQAY